MTDIIKQFLEWAGKEGYDTAHTYDTERSQWVVFNPMTADLWKAYQAGAAQEREACAKVCEKAGADIWKYHDDGRTEIGQTVCSNLARAIRAKERTP